MQMGRKRTSELGQDLSSRLRWARPPLCGRYSLGVTREELIEVFDVGTARDVVPALPRWNIAPTQEAPALLLGSEGPRLGPLRWGLIPSWAGDVSIGSRLINARSETVHRRRAFREALPRRRCLVPADGFFEWRREPGGRPKTPFWIHPAAGGLLTFAALWERWGHGARETIYTFTILTTSANRWMGDIHDRMPVIVGHDDRELWMERDAPMSDVNALLAPPAEALLAARRVSTYVNRPANEGPRCVEAIG